MSNQSSSSKNMFFEEENVHQGKCVLLMMQVVTCGSVPLESSYQKVNRCIYTSTVLHQCKCFFVRPGASKQHQCYSWGLRHVEVRLTGGPWIRYGKLVGWLQQSALLSELYFIDFLHFSWSVCFHLLAYSTFWLLRMWSADSSLKHHWFFPAAICCRLLHLRSSDWYKSSSKIWLWSFCDSICGGKCDSGC